MKLLVLFFLLMSTSCSSITYTFIKPRLGTNKIFAGTANNIDWVRQAPKNEVHPYTTMGLIDFVPSVFGDLILLPYTIYDNYVQPIDTI